MFALLSGPRVRSVFMRFLRPSVRVTREHAQTHEHLCVLSEGTGWDGGRARRGARLALVSLIICGSVNPRASAFTRRWVITSPITFYAAPEEPARRSGRCTPLAGPAVAPGPVVADPLAGPTVAPGPVVVGSLETVVYTSGHEGLKVDDRWRLAHGSHATRQMLQH